MPGIGARCCIVRLPVEESYVSIARNIRGQQQDVSEDVRLPKLAKKMFPQSVTPRPAPANNSQVESGLQESGACRQSFGDLDRWMERYQQADPDAPAVLVGNLSPALLRFFKSQTASREHADDLLQATWLRIHRVRHTYRPGEPVVPWIYAIARRVRVDGYRRTRRILLHETRMEVLPERPARAEGRDANPTFETLVAALPEAQREVVTMLKVGGLSLEEVARATSSTVGAVKQKAHRAYGRLRKVLQVGAEEGREELLNEGQ
jgi:RNA polymerase sigma-70 factor (ECF subfamily)